MILGQDTLNTHTLASLYEALAPEEARRLIATLEGHATPTHGSWLNRADMERGGLRRQCLDGRMPAWATLVHQVTAWQRERNAAQGKGKWQFTPAEARVKLKRLYPILEPVKSKQTDH